MERYCGRNVSGVIGSKRFPWADLDRRVLDEARLTQIKLHYNKIKELSLTHPKGQPIGAHQSPQCEQSQSLLYGHYLFLADKSCILLPPRRHFATTDAPPALEGAFVTRFNSKKDLKAIRSLLKTASMDCWGRLRRVDTEAGDTIRAAAIVPNQEDSRDASFVKVRIEYYLINTILTSF
jgi:hypothetical protein